MQVLDLTLPTPQENLALDDALLTRAELDHGSPEVLRLWEPASTMVVVGRSSRVAVEVNENACHEQGIPILRRASGGAAIVASEGCLMYAVVLNLELQPWLRAIEAAHAHVLGRLVQALHPLVSDVRRQGISDVVSGDRKFSGNSLRVKRSHLLYHGTLMYALPTGLIEQLLRPPPRQPAYRGGRTHSQFVMNLPLDAQTLRQRLVQAWEIDETCLDWPRELTARLANEQYANPDWTYRL